MDVGCENGHHITIVQQVRERVILLLRATRGAPSYYSDLKYVL